MLALRDESFGVGSLPTTSSAANTPQSDILSEQKGVGSVDLQKLNVTKRRFSQRTRTWKKGPKTIIKIQELSSRQDYVEKCSLQSLVLEICHTYEVKFVECDPLLKLDLRDWGTC
jgi:hypothetical protein